MKLGDIVQHLGRYWMVHRYDAKRSRTATLLAADGTTVEVPHDLDTIGGVEIIANPSQDWPFVIAPTKPGMTIIKISHEGADIPPLVGWFANDPLNAGGPIFLAPDPALRYGSHLIMHYRDTDNIVHHPHAVLLVRISIPRGFGSVQHRINQANARKPKPPERLSAFQRLRTKTDIWDD